MNIKLFPASGRGSADHGWLKVNHTFSFGGWYNPDLIHFGALRVLNDDRIAPSMGFSTHPHDNMEIITIPLKGSLKHKDSMGNGSVITAGEVQVMSAGSGIYHSEENPDPNTELNLFQIWIFPNAKNVEPRYDQIQYSLEVNKNRMVQVVSPNQDDEGTWIHQNAWINLGAFNKNEAICVPVHSTNSGLFIMNIEGELEVEGNALKQRDAVGIWEVKEVKVKIKEDARLMIIEVPMEF